MNVRRADMPQQPRRPATARAVHGQRLTPLEAIALLVLASALVYAALSTSGERPLSDFDTVTVRIQPSDTLWSVAARCEVEGLDTAGTIQVIQELNGMSDASIAAGQLLVVPRATNGATALASLD